MHKVDQVHQTDEGPGDKRSKKVIHGKHFVVDSNNKRFNVVKFFGRLEIMNYLQPYGRFCESTTSDKHATSEHASHS